MPAFLSTSEEGEYSHDLADLPGGLRMRERLSERVAAQGVGGKGPRRTIPAPAGGKLSVDDVLKHAGTIAAGAFGEAAAPGMCSSSTARARRRRGAATQRFTCLRRALPLAQRAAQTWPRLWPPL